MNESSYWQSYRNSKTCCLGNGKCSSLVKTCYLEIGGEIAKTVTGHNHRESWILG